MFGSEKSLGSNFIYQAPAMCNSTSACTAPTGRVYEITMEEGDSTTSSRRSDYSQEETAVLLREVQARSGQMYGHVSLDLHSILFNEWFYVYLMWLSE